MNRPSLNSRRLGRAPTGGRTTRKRGAALIASAALAASAVSALPASATLTGNGVREGANITVFHNIDFVAVFGYGAVGDPITVEVLRNGASIGTATGPAVDAEGLPGLEVNHGPEVVPPADGDCWTGHTPDIRPGDVIQVTTADGVTDEVTVDNIGFTGGPRELGNGDIVVPFVAKLANGNPVPLARIDSAEFRAATNNSVRFEGAQVLVQRTGAPGRYQVRYPSPFRPTRNDRDAPFNQRQLRRALLGDGHAIGFGHVDPLPLESMLYDGLEDTPGPAPGCEAAPSAQWSVTNVAPGSLNRHNQGRTLTVRGVSHNASDVTVSLTDRDPTTTAAPTATATMSADTGAQTWVARFAPAELADLNGRIVARAVHTLVDGSFQGPNMSVLRDLVAPSAPRVSLRSGTYRRAKRVVLRSAPRNQIRYTLGNRQARPTRNRGTVYRGQRIRISATQTLKAIAIDPAGNVSPLAKRRYRIR